MINDLENIALVLNTNELTSTQSTIVNAMHTKIEKQQAEITTLRAQLEACKKDAERMPLVVDCKICDNRGKANGLTQESFCDHCIHGTSWKRNYYKPTDNAKKVTL